MCEQIIRCKDCKYYKKVKWNGVLLKYTVESEVCVRWGNVPNETNGNGYCFLAEPKEGRMKDEVRFEPPVFCSFCGRPRRLVSKLVETDVITNVYAPHPIYICDECIDAAYELIHEEAGEGNE